MQTATLIGVYLAASIPMWLGAVSFLVHGARDGMKKFLTRAEQPALVVAEAHAPRRPELVLVGE